MPADYSVETVNNIEQQFQSLNLYRPIRKDRYEQGAQLTYDVNGIDKVASGFVKLEIEKFVGGGFAGQVYKVKILELNPALSEILKIGHSYAMKILIPPSGFSTFFRNTLYRIGFQGPFQLQYNETASREGALWQKFIRRAAQARFGDKFLVNNIHATFVDHTLGSCGEFSDWVEGRTWRLEVNNRMDLLNRVLKGKSQDIEHAGSPEYRTKREYMGKFVELLHELGAHEFARQYEWSTCKSQPNCLKLTSSDPDPEKGLIAVDFRAGLALLPFLPMSPGDFKLILQGMGRGSLVQFDRGDTDQLEKYVKEHANDFDGMTGLLDDLKQCSKHYRNSIPDITHNGGKLLYSGKLWGTIFESSRNAWHTGNLIDDKTKEKLKGSAFLTFIFMILGAVPVLGRVIRKLWGHGNWRKHYSSILSSPSYLMKSLKGKCAEKAMNWYRQKRISEKRALNLTKNMPVFLLHMILSILPASVHTFFTSWTRVKEVFYGIVFRPILLYFKADLREKWLYEMLDEGKKNRILDDEDARVIQEQIKEPYIQKYLKCLAVHVCTLPVTQVVSIIVSYIYVIMHPELSAGEATAAVAAILILFQITPVSPGSLVRGLYVVYLVIREWNFKDYNIAIFLGFFKYIGYLAFPIQMTYRYPELARFMAAHWATGASHVVPVFGEKGALLEHWVYTIFYNWPITIRRRMRIISKMRESMQPRYWHVFAYSILAVGLFLGLDEALLRAHGNIPTTKSIWYVFSLIGFTGGISITLGAGGATRAKRFLAALVWGILTAGAYTVASSFLHPSAASLADQFLMQGTWRFFILAVFGVLGALITELSLKDPDLKT